MSRRGIRKLEIDAYRLRNDSSRLEAVLEDGIANGEVETRSRHEHDRIRPAQHERQRSDDFTSPIDTAVTDFGEPWAPESILTDGPSEPAAEPLHPAVESASDNVSADVELSSATVFSAQPRRKYRYTTPPVLASLSLHGALVLNCSSTLGLCGRGSNP